MTDMPATQEKPAVEIDLGGKTWKFVVDLNVLSDVETLTSVNLATKIAWDNLSLSVVRAFLYASFRVSDPTVTQEKIGSWVTLQNFAYVVGKFREALTASMVKDEETPEGEAAADPLETTATSDSTG
jgi:hypothetical protein